MFCPKCGAENADDSRFCIQCGTSLENWRVAAPPKALPAERPAPRRIGRPRVLWGGIAVVALLVGLMGLYAVTQIALPELFPRKPAKRAKPTPIFGAEPTEEAITAPPGLERLEAWGPEAAERFLVPEDYDQLTAIASDFTHPLRRPLVTGTVTIASLVNTPSNYTDKTVIIAGRVLKRTLLYDLLAEDWPRSYLLVVDDGTGSIPVVYRGYAQEINAGDEVKVTGYLSQYGGGIHADVVEKTGRWREVTKSPRLMSLLGIFSGIGTLAFAVLSGALLWRVSRRTRVGAKAEERA